MEKSIVASEMIKKSNEVITSLNCFRAAGVSALREIIRKQINALDWSMGYPNRVLKELEESLGDFQDALSDSDFDLYPYMIAEAVDEAVSSNIYDENGNAIGFELMPYTDLADLLLYIFNEYLETYNVA